MPELCMHHPCLLAKPATHSMTCRSFQQAPTPVVPTASPPHVRTRRPSSAKPGVERLPPVRGGDGAPTPHKDSALDAAARMLVRTAVAVDLVGARRPPAPPAPAPWIMQLQLPKGSRTRSGSDESDSDSEDSEGEQAWGGTVVADAAPLPATPRAIMPSSKVAQSNDARPRSRATNKGPESQRSTRARSGSRSGDAMGRSEDPGSGATTSGRAPSTGPSTSAHSVALQPGPSVRPPSRARARSVVQLSTDVAGIADLQLLVEDMTGTEYVC